MTPRPPSAHRRGENTLERLAFLGFFVLFPGFFLYHVVVALGFAPDVASGLWGYASALFALVTLAGLPVLRRGLVGARTFLVPQLLMLLFGYTALWCGINYLTSNSPYIGPAFVQMVGTLISWIALVGVGAWLPWWSVRLRSTLLVALIVIAVLIALLFDTSRLVFDMRMYSGYEVDPVTYQSYARSVAALGIVLMATVRSRNAAAALFLFTTALLFAIGARSELFAYVGTMLVCGVLILSHQSLGGRAHVVLLAFAAALAAVIAIAALDHSALLASRQLQVFELSEARSWIERDELLDGAVDDVLSNPLLGNFTSHWESTYSNKGGAYAHNVISAWVSLGAVGFLLYAALLVLPLAVATRKTLQADSPRRVWTLAMMCTLFCFVLAAFSKPVFWSLPAFSWGLMLNGLRWETKAVSGAVRPSIRRARRTTAPFATDASSPRRHHAR